MTEEDEMEKLSLMYAVCDACSNISAYAERCESVVVNYRQGLSFEAIALLNRSLKHPLAPGDRFFDHISFSNGKP